MAGKGSGIVQSGDERYEGAEEGQIQKTHHACGYPQSPLPCAQIEFLTIMPPNEGSHRPKNERQKHYSNTRAQDKHIEHFVFRPSDSLENHERVINRQVKPAVRIPLECNFFLAVHVPVHKRSYFPQLFGMSAEIFKLVDGDCAVTIARYLYFSKGILRFEQIAL